MQAPKNTSAVKCQLLSENPNNRTTKGVLLFVQIPMMHAHVYCKVVACFEAYVTSAPVAASLHTLDNKGVMESR